MIKFRKLKADEVEVRVATVKEKGCSLLLYKDARVDMNLLDETVGAFNWQRRHCRDNANCIVSIWDDTKKQWIEKEDTGTESFTEKEKGLASDSFKRACFNIGIGRELYTAPFIWVTNVNISESKGKFTTYDKFSVTAIDYDENGTISHLTVYNDTKKAVCYQFNNGKSEYIKTHEQPKEAVKEENTPVAEKEEELTEYQTKVRNNLIRLYNAHVTGFETPEKVKQFIRDKSGIRKAEKVDDIKKLETLKAINEMLTKKEA